MLSLSNKCSMRCPRSKLVLDQSGSTLSPVCFHVGTKRVRRKCRNSDRQGHWLACQFKAEAHIRHEASCYILVSLKRNFTRQQSWEKIIPYIEGYNENEWGKFLSHLFSSTIVNSVQYHMFDKNNLNWFKSSLRAFQKPILVLYII